MLGIAKGLLGIGAFKQRLPRADEALPGREHPLPLHNQHYVNSHPLKDGFAGLERIRFAMGCFSGAPSASSGRCRGCIRRRWGMPAG